MNVWAAVCTSNSTVVDSLCWHAGVGHKSLLILLSKLLILARFAEAVSAPPPSISSEGIVECCQECSGKS